MLNFRKILILIFLFPQLLHNVFSNAPLIITDINNLLNCQTAIENRAWKISNYNLKNNTNKVYWSLVQAPSGMIINPINGIISWKWPRKGRHLIKVCATNETGNDFAEFILNVVDDVPGHKIVSTKYIDYVVPTNYAKWMKRWEPEPVIDFIWEHIRSLSGREPIDGKQVIFQDPKMGGGAHNGNPIKMGPGWFSEDKKIGWDVLIGVASHELAHNFSGTIGLNGGEKWPNFDRFIHHYCEFYQLAVLDKLKKNANKLNLKKDSLKNLLDRLEEINKEKIKRFQNSGYEKWLKDGKKATDFKGDAYGVWSYILFDLYNKYGISLIENTIRAFRSDGISRELIKKADSEEKRKSLLFSTMSTYAKKDLHDYFIKMGFSHDKKFYYTIAKEVKDSIGKIKQKDLDGWKFCQLNGRYYRLTPWKSSFFGARWLAKQLGGELVTIRNEKESNWLRGAFGDDTYYIGLSDYNKEGKWEWLSGEELKWKNWGEIEPNGGDFENCVVTSWGEPRMKWVDINFNGDRLGIIEKKGYLIY